MHSTCYACKEGYVKKDNLCVPLHVSNCTLSSFLLNNSVDDSEEEGNYTYIDLKENYNRCNSLCQGSKYVKISYFYEITKQVKVYYDKNTNKVYDNIPNSKNNDEILSSESYFTDNTIFTTTDAYFTDSEGSDVEFADDENIPQESDLVEAKIISGKNRYNYKENSSLSGGIIAAIVVVIVVVLTIIALIIIFRKKLFNRKEASIKDSISDTVKDFKITETTNN